ncbi:MAG: hypothetical protein ABFD92_13820 [Planctomycetaceae bacterium]|nr:hypothetical protein [Planctomycetaceae bacterium]
MFCVCRGDSDLVRVLGDSGAAFRHAADAADAVAQAAAGEGVLILADDYPQRQREISADLLDAARDKSLRLYIEFPASLPGLECGQMRSTEWERGVVASDAFAPDLERLSILAIHGCRFAPVDAASVTPHIVVARVAGFDRAVFGLPPVDKIWPVLFEHDGMLVASTRLSGFVTGRFAPAGAWRAIWAWIVRWAGAGDVDLRWTPTVRASLGKDEALDGSVQRRAMARGADWFTNARLFIHPSWADQAERYMLAPGADTAAPGPRAEWPCGDGRCGMIEGARSFIYPDGTQMWRYMRRNDCMGEAAGAMAMAGKARDDAAGQAIAANLCDHIYTLSNLAQGPRAEPSSPSYGLVRWYPTDNNGVYYGDDNARSMMGTMLTAAVLKSDRWTEPLARCLLANLRTTGPQGFRSGRLDEEMLQEKGWRHFWTTPRTNFAPHYESWLWACFLWAYARSGYEPFRQRACNAIAMTMDAYPDQWHWTNGIQQERARMLLPLAWRVRVDDTPENRRQLRFMAEQLLAFQDSCGAIREEIGSAGRGDYGPPASNEAYGTNEATLIAANGDPVCDLLYTTNFAYVGLHEAAAATGDSYFIEAAQRLTDFLLRIQVRSERHRELDGAWFRAFDYGRWDYWASNADLGWGVWSIESGWTQAWIVSVLAMREMKTSFWDVTGKVDLRGPTAEYAAAMLGGEDD